MNYVSQINAFELWCENHYLPALSQLLWFKLFKLNNRTGWAEWVQVDSHRLMVEIQVKREHTFIDIRNRLVSAGLIEYQKGKKGFPSRYKMIPLYDELTGTSAANTATQTATNSAVNTATQTATIYKDKRKTKTNTPLPPLDGFSVDEQKIVEAWLAYKSERKEPYTPTGHSRLLGKFRRSLDAHGVDAVGDIVDYSMSNMYQGIVWDRIKSTPKPQTIEDLYGGEFT